MEEKTLTTSQEKFLANIEANLEGVDFFSVGLATKCTRCRSDYGYTNKPSQFSKGVRNGRICDEGSFSFRTCDSCSTGYGGNRFAAHGFIKMPVYRNGRPIKRTKEVLVHFDVCTDCLVYHANGDLPEDWRES